MAREGDEFSVNVRMGEVETLKESGSRGLGLRVFLGRRSGSASTSDLTAEGIRQLVEGALALAAVTEEDPFAGLPETGEFGAVPGRFAPLLRRCVLARRARSGSSGRGGLRLRRCGRPAHHKLRRRQLRCRDRTQGAGQLARICGQLSHQLRGRGGSAAGQRRRRQNAARRLVVERAASERCGIS